MSAPQADRGRSRRAAPKRRRTGAIVAGVVAGVAVVGLVVSAVVVAQGYDAQHVSRLDAGVWVYRDAGQYARVDTDLAQIDTVRDVEDPRGVLQDGSSGVVLTDALRKRWTIDASAPADLVASSTSGGSTSPASDTTASPAPSSSAAASGSGSGAVGEDTPNGTREVLASGAWSVYLTDAGKVYLARLGATGTAATPVQIDPLQASGAGSGDAYAATAVAVADDGQVVTYSAKEHAVRRYDATTSTWTGGAQAVPSPPAGDADVVLTTVGGRWVLGQPGRDRVWVQGHGAPISVKLAADAVAEQGSSTGDRAYLADQDGLVEIALQDGTARRIGSGGGTPAAPAVVHGTVYAAWLAEGGGRLWSSAGADKALAVPDGQLTQTRAISPVIASNGTRAVLDETSTGLLWSVPDGTAIPLSQWTVDQDRTTQQAGQVQVPDVAEEEPPVAEADSFGVRAGGTVLLPVLLNDHDPNKRDVLTIDGSSIGAGLSDPGFGTLSLAADDQQLVVDVHAQSGSATFSYAVTDGQESSPPATVTLHVVPTSQNTAPQWCGVDGCLQTWPTASLAPGATTTVSVLDGWVDPDGDPFVLSAATADGRSPLTVVPTADGRVAIRHDDPNGGPGTYGVTVTVTDAQGASSTKELTVSVSGGSALDAGSFAAVGRTGDPVTVSIDDHVQGGSGSYRLLDAVAADAQKNAVTVVPNAAAGEIALTASQPGQYLVSYTVQDSLTQADQTAQIRFSVADGAGAIGIPPITAFVRPDEDSTVDVLRSVQNTTGRVLALASATTSDPGLTASVIAGSQLRLSGTTADGQAGKVGTVALTVTDGAGTTATGRVTVFLAQATTGVAPIAIPDAVTVRAGAQVDIPVTANDIAPRGEQLELSPDVQGSGADGELVFASGQDVRYLAPPKAGVLTLRYSVSLAGDPDRTATAAITVTVVATGSDHAPEPETLTARAIAGQTVSIPVPTATADPDGDATVVSQVDQPKAGQGTASVGPDAASLRYTAPAGGVPGGQVVFSYTLSDGRGATGSADVHVAVLDGALTDVAPVTYADAVRAVTGSGDALTVEPLANDSDPAGGGLKLVSLVPDAPDVPGNPEYARLKGLIDPATDMAKGVVKLRAGDVEGVQAYVYTVESTLTSSTAQGLIVVTVAPSATAQPPTVQDTVLSIANRSQLASGVDVVTGRTQWSTGDLSTLTLSVWGEAASSYTVRGFRISGPEPDGGAVVPFKLSGKDASGDAVVGYGFLRIPALDDMRLQLSADATALRVGEEQSGTARLGDLVDLGPGDRLEQKGGSYAVQRANASCKADGGLDVTYDAGREAPWTDSCTVLVRIVGQDTWTALPIPVTIQPKAPQAILSPVSRTVAPGSSQTIDLYGDLTSWEGGRVGDQTKLDYKVAYSGSQFEVVQSGRTVTVSARADARPGARETATVTVTGFGGLTTNIALVVGIAAPDAPRPVTFTRQCSVAQGTSCSIPVVGIAGEYDPFAGKTGSGLKLVGIGQPNCPVASISVNGGSSITATWPGSAKPAGGSCIVPYTVADAQGRTGTATLTIDVQGYPAAPDSVTQAAFTATTVNLLVTLGDAALAHPALTGVRIDENGADVNASCAPGSRGTYLCTVSGLQNGQHHQYTARAVNAVGESLDTSKVESWAYQAPSLGPVTATPIYVENVTSQSVAVVDLKMSGDQTTKSFAIQVDGRNVDTIDADHDNTAEKQLQMNPGQHQVTVTPISQYQAPIGSSSAGSSTSVPVTAAGSPIIRNNGSLKATSNTTAEYDNFSVDQNSAPSVTTLYALFPSNQAEPDCSMDANGKPVMTGGQADNHFTNLDEGTNYSAKVCTANGFGWRDTSQDNVPVFTGIDPPSGLTYKVGTAAALTGTTAAAWTSVAAPTATPPNSHYSTYYSANGGQFSTTFPTSEFRLDSNPPSIKARYCRTGTSQCSDTADVLPLSGSAPTVAQVSIPACFDTGTLGLATPASSDVSPSRAIQGAYSVTPSTLTDTDTGAKTAQYVVTLTGSYASLGTVTLSTPYCT